MKAEPGGQLLRCRASANWMPWEASASAAATDCSSSARTFFRPSSLVKASQISFSSNPCRLCRTQAVSRRTVFAIQIVSASNSNRAAAAGFGLSLVNSRTKTLVSTAIMTPAHLACKSSIRLCKRFRLTFGPKRANHLADIGLRETARGAEQNSIDGFFDCKFRSWAPGAGCAYALGQDHLSLGGEPRGSHGRLRGAHLNYFAARNPSTVWINKSGWSTKVMWPLWGMTASFEPTILSLI
jgi:hypothetical protein